MDACTTTEIGGYNMKRLLTLLVFSIALCSVSSVALASVPATSKETKQIVLADDEPAPSPEPAPEAPKPEQ